MVKSILEGVGYGVGRREKWRERGVVVFKTIVGCGVAGGGCENRRNLRQGYGYTHESLFTTYLSL